MHIYKYENENNKGCEEERIVMLMKEYVLPWEIEKHSSILGRGSRHESDETDNTK